MTPTRKRDSHSPRRVNPPTCPHCGKRLWVGPVLTVDFVAEVDLGANRLGVLLVRRSTPPLLWALPGGLVDYGERVEEAVRREVREETGTEVEDLRLVGVYSDPSRDVRFHSVTIVFAGSVQGEPKVGDEREVSEIGVFPLDNLPPAPEIAFDHAQILADYVRHKAGG